MLTQSEEYMIHHGREGMALKTAHCVVAGTGYTAEKA